jgi:ribonucleoside-diphosphate reductase beta chain
MIGLNTELLGQYIEFICTRRMKNVNLTSPYDVKTNPLPWTQKWISGADVQVAPQETEITSYVSGGTKQDVSTDTFKGFSL